MRIPTKKLKNGFELPVYGLGLWQMGGRFEEDRTNDEADIKAIKYAIEQGVTYIDTAEAYGDGHAEELLGEVLKNVDRSKLVISTKVSGNNQGYDGVLDACEKSLKRMGTDYIDLFMLHRFPDPEFSIKETMRAMDELVESGKVRHIGVSNCAPKRFESAQKHSKNKLVYNQLHYNVEYREVEKYGLEKHAVDNDYFLCAWRPLQKDLLDTSAPILDEMANKYGKTKYQIAINWLISQPNVITLSKTSTPVHLDENLGALDWDMSEEDIERIRQEFPNQKYASDAVPLDYEAASLL